MQAHDRSYMKDQSPFSLHTLSRLGKEPFSALARACHYSQQRFSAGNTSLSSRWSSSEGRHESGILAFYHLSGLIDVNRLPAHKVTEDTPAPALLIWGRPVRSPFPFPPTNMLYRLHNPPTVSRKKCTRDTLRFKHVTPSHTSGIL